MFLGISPGNLGSMSYLDVYRRESQRDFADGIRGPSRALIEGLFGVKPNALAGELFVEPGFPSTWDHASLRHPDLKFSFQRQDEIRRVCDRARVIQPQKLRLIVTATHDRAASVEIDAKPAGWRMELRDR